MILPQRLFNDDGNQFKLRDLVMKFGLIYNEQIDKLNKISNKYHSNIPFPINNIKSIFRHKRPESQHRKDNIKSQFKDTVTIVFANININKIPKDIKIIGKTYSIKCDIRDKDELTIASTKYLKDCYTCGRVTCPKKCPFYQEVLEQRLNEKRNNENLRNLKPMGKYCQHCGMIGGHWRNNWKCDKIHKYLNNNTNKLETVGYHCNHCNSSNHGTILSPICPTIAGYTLRVLTYNSGFLANTKYLKNGYFNQDLWLPQKVFIKPTLENCKYWRTWQTASNFIYQNAIENINKQKLNYKRMSRNDYLQLKRNKQNKSINKNKIKQNIITIDEVEQLGSNLSSNDISISDNIEYNNNNNNNNNVNNNPINNLDIDMQDIENNKNYKNNFIPNENDNENNHKNENDINIKTTRRSNSSSSTSLNNNFPSINKHKQLAQFRSKSKSLMKKKLSNKHTSNKSMHYSKRKQFLKNKTINKTKPNKNNNNKNNNRNNLRNKNKNIPTININNNNNQISNQRSSVHTHASGRLGQIRPTNHTTLNPNFRRGFRTNHPSNRPPPLNTVIQQQNQFQQQILQQQQHKSKFNKNANFRISKLISKHDKNGDWGSAKQLQQHNLHQQQLELDTNNKMNEAALNPYKYYDKNPPTQQAHSFGLPFDVRLI